MAALQGGLVEMDMSVEKEDSRIKEVHADAMKVLCNGLRGDGHGRARSEKSRFVE